MNTNQMNAIRDLAERCFTAGDWAVIRGDHVFAIHLHEGQAREWASFIAGAEVVPMSEALKMSDSNPLEWVKAI